MLGERSSQAKEDYLCTEAVDVATHIPKVSNCIAYSRENAIGQLSNMG